MRFGRNGSAPGGTIGRRRCALTAKFTSFISKEGDVTAIAVSRELRVLTHNKFSEGLIAGPAIAGNGLVLRSESHLYYVAEGFQTPPK